MNICERLETANTEQQWNKLHAQSVSDSALVANFKSKKVSF